VPTTGRSLQAFHTVEYTYGSVSLNWYGAHGSSTADPIERAINIAEATPTDKIRMLLLEDGWHELAYFVTPNRADAPLVGPLVVWSCIQADWEHPMTLAIFKACEVMYAGTELWGHGRDAKSTAADFFYVLTQRPEARDQLIELACKRHAYLSGGELIRGGYHGQPVLRGVDC
jgi:hypothetical protein